jgi:hypothetical protein
MITVKNVAVPIVVGGIISGSKFADQKLAASGKPAVAEKIVVYGGAVAAVAASVFMKGRIPSIVEEARSPLISAASERVFDMMINAATGTNTQVVVRENATNRVVAASPRLLVSGGSPVRDNVTLPSFANQRSY